MRVLLTGASGFIGRYVFRQLTQRGIEIVVLGRRRPTEHRGDYVETDLLRFDSIAANVQHARATHLIHLAWYAEHGRYWNSPLNLRWLEATVRLVEAFCAAGGEHVVAAGSCSEYDWSYGYCCEDTTPLRPNSMYGTAKDATRRLVSAVCQAHRVSLAWGRIFMPYGPGEDGRRLIPSLIDVFQGKRPPFGVNANAFRDYLHVEDVAHGLVQLMLSRAEGDYNISSGQPIQIAQIVRMIAEALNGDPCIVLELRTERPGDPEILIGNNHKLKELGWQPQIEISRIIDYLGA